MAIWCNLVPSSQRCCSSRRDRVGVLCVVDRVVDVDVDLKRSFVLFALGATL